MGLNKRLISSEVAGAAAGGFFEVVTYSGTSAEQSFDIGFEPDIIWIKGRNTSGRNYFIWDEDGTFRYGVPYTTGATETATGVTTSSTGFTLQSSFGWNYTGITYVALCWKAGSFADGSSSQATNVRVAADVNNGFSLIKFTTSNSTAQPPPLNYITHGLNSQHELVLYKRIDASQSGSWLIHAPSLSDNGGLLLNTTDALGSGNTYDFFDTTSTQIAVRSNYAVSRGANYIALVFHSVSGVSKIGTYTGNGSSSGPTVTTGFEPKFLMVKRTSSSGSNWWMVDAERSPNNPRNNRLLANTADTETVYTPGNINFSSTGFQLAGSSGEINSSGATYIYMAFA